MIRYYTPFNGKRFIGDTGQTIVHDLLFEKKYLDKNGCKIDDIETNQIRTFDPDRLEQATKEGYKPCKYCLLFNQ